MTGARTAVRIAWAAAAAAALVSPAEAQDSGPSPDSPVAPLIERFSTDWEEIESAWRLPMSARWTSARDGFLQQWTGITEEFEADPADPRACADLSMLRSEIALRRRRAALDDAPRAETLRLAPFGPGLVALEESRRRMEDVPPETAAARLDAAKKSLADVRAKVERGLGKKPEDAANDALVTTPVAALRASREVGALRGALRRWFENRDGFEPEFGWWVRKPWAALDADLGGYETFLREKAAGAADVASGDGPLVGDPIGRDALVAELEGEEIPYTPEEILAVAEREFAWCRAEARKAAAEMGLGDDWKAALAKVKTLHQPPGKQAALVREQSVEAIAFVESRNLVTVPELCRNVWRLDMIPEGTQKTMPYAYYSGQAMGVAYPTDGMEHDRKLQAMRGNNVHFSRIVTPHELIPGHHLQLHYAARHRTYRSLFRTPFLVEGWALYWEMRLWDLGWARGPEDRIGMLFWRMHRCARILVTVKFHLGQMTAPQMVDFLVSEVGHEKDGATAEVRRYVGGAYGPLYQAAYMLGGLQLRALHKETVGAGKMTERAFHDAVLRENSVPVRMIRAALLGERPGEGGRFAPWRFAD
ncbi:MAG: hypothetical protein HMLKMBBP_01867 [Planctomycetes bacterium]|nr:hypothetical protein [Planctomycetota bacterium]